MKSEIFFCEKCNVYTLKEVHDCGEKTIVKIPPKYSPVDKYSKYRLEAKKEKWYEKKQKEKK